MQCAKITARKMYQWAAEEFDDSEARTLATFGNKALSRSGLINMIEMSKVELNISETEFDANDYLFNTQGGTINLKEYSYHTPDPKNMITMLAGTSYTPDAVCPRWKQFLAEVMPDESMRLFLQRAVGYSLSGSTKEQCLFFLYGSGANGKSTFLKVIQTMLGEYGRQMLPTVLLAGERHPTELAALAGVRFACTVEVEEGRKMAEVLVKQLTGQDKIAARHLF
jgi:putative DNA primase/helicase